MCTLDHGYPTFESRFLQTFQYIRGAGTRLLLLPPPAGGGGSICAAPDQAKRGQKRLDAQPETELRPRNQDPGSTRETNEACVPNSSSFGYSVPMLMCLETG